MKLKKLLPLLFLAYSISMTAFAEDPVAKEELTPPAAEGAITADQITPIKSAATPTAPAPVNTPPAPQQNS